MRFEIAFRDCQYILAKFDDGLWRENILSDYALKFIAHWLINHQFKVNGSYSVGSVVSNIFGPSFALNVNDYATLKY